MLYTATQQLPALVTYALQHLLASCGFTPPFSLGLGSRVLWL